MKADQARKKVESMATDDVTKAYIKAYLSQADILIEHEASKGGYCVEMKIRMANVRRAKLVVEEMVKDLRARGYRAWSYDGYVWWFPFSQEWTIEIDWKPEKEKK